MSAPKRASAGCCAHVRKEWQNYAWAQSSKSNAKSPQTCHSVQFITLTKSCGRSHARRHAHVAIQSKGECAAACDIRTRAKIRQHMRVDSHYHGLLSIWPSRTWMCRDLNTNTRIGSVYKGAQQQAESSLPPICHHSVQLAAAKKLARAAGRAPPCAGQKSERGTCGAACAFQRAMSERERNFVSTCS